VTLLQLIRRFSPYLMAVRHQALVALALAVLEPLVAVALIWVAKSITDTVFVDRQIGLLPLFAGVFLGLSALKVGLEYATTRIEAGVLETILRALRTNLYRHLLRLSPGSLGRRGTGDLLAHLSDDAERAEYLIFTGVIAAVADAAAVLFFVISLFFLSWKLTLCALLAVPLLILASARLSPQIRRAGRIARHRASLWMALAEERLGASLVIHSFGAQDAEVDRFAKRLDAARRAELKTVSVQALMSAVIEASIAVGGVLVFSLGAYEILYGDVTLGTLVAFVGSIGSLYDPTSGLAKAWGRFQRAAAAAQRLADLLDTPSLVVDHPRARPMPPKVRGELAFRNERFAYPTGPEVIRGRLARRRARRDGRPGRPERLWEVDPRPARPAPVDPTAGAVLIDGHDLRDLTIESVRRAVGLVFQEPFIFQGTVADNIRYGRADAPDELVEAMGRAAHADGFVRARLGGYAAQTGPGGSWLSTGQRQRIALARAFVRDAPILILDEATASVDSETEELIQDAVERFASRRTILLVAHCLSSVRRADRVIVLDRGEVVETGTPDTLLRGGTRCRDLFAAQLVGEEVLA
jgi:ABC-type multidrug transport system fused ATPase/permease subunit